MALRSMFHSTNKWNGGPGRALLLIHRTLAYPMRFSCLLKTENRNRSDPSLERPFSPLSGRQRSRYLKANRSVLCRETSPASRKTFRNIFSATVTFAVEDARRLFPHHEHFRHVRFSAGRSHLSILSGRPKGATNLQSTYFKTSVLETTV